MKPRPDCLRDVVDAVIEALDEGRAHGVPPSRFTDEPRDFRLAAPNGIHFHLLRELGVPDAETRDPIEWERMSRRVADLDSSS